MKNIYFGEIFWVPLTNLMVFSIKTVHWSSKFEKQQIILGDSTLACNLVEGKVLE